VTADEQRALIADLEYDDVRDLAVAFFDALCDVDAYLANVPDLWTIGNVAAAGNVLCDALGMDVIAEINADVLPPLCAECKAARAGSCMPS
jgi:hypothetical protein